MTLHISLLSVLLCAALGAPAVSGAQETSSDRREELETERVRLQKRIEDIDAQLTLLRPMEAASAGLELTADIISLEVLQAPYEYALPVRIKGRPWEVKPGDRLQIIGAVRKSIDRFWRVTDGTRTGYVQDLGVDVFRNGAELSPYKEVDEALEELRGTWDIHLEKIANGRDLLVLGVFPDGPNSAGGVGAKIIWRHLVAERTIKYITFIVTPFNAVGDQVLDSHDGGSTRKLHATGPLDARLPGVERFDEESWWDPQWYNNSISCLQLDRIDIEFLDGTTMSYSTDLVRVLSPEFQNDCAFR